MSERRHPHVVNLDELGASTASRGTKFGASRKSLGMATGARGIGASWYEVPPGRSAFPFHFHCINDEAMFVLEGEGSLRIGGDTIAVRAGDYVSFPPGRDAAHRLDNTGAAPLRYLCLSTMVPGEVAVYPDSNKVGCYASVSVDAAHRRERLIMQLGKLGDSLDYYEGEDVG